MLAAKRKLPLWKLTFMRPLLFATLLLVSFSLSAQEAKVVPIETFPVDATLISPLEGSIDRGIIRIERIQNNPYQIESGDTLLVKFYFTLKAMNNEPDLVGIKSGETFSARMAARQNNFDGSYFYQVYHYKNISRIKALKREESLSSDEPQK